MKEEILILSKLEYTISSSSMKRQRHPKRDLKVSPKDAVKTNSRSRQSNLRQGQSTFSWDPDFFCSDSDSSLVSTDVDELLTPPAPVVVDLTTKCDSDTNCLVNVSPAQSKEDNVVLLSSGEENKAHKSKSKTVRPSTPASILLRKISLPLESMAEDTLETVRLNKDSSGQKWTSYSPSKSYTGSHNGFDSQVYETLSEDSGNSGPSSPHTAPIPLRCTECEKLFTKMKRQGPPKTKKRDKDPTSLSCDVWLLKKIWCPQRRRQVKGRLWVHLKRIRNLAVKNSTAEMPKMLCSRPHIFLKRNLRRCRERYAVAGGASKSKTKSHRRRHRATNAWPPPNTKHRRPRKRKYAEDSVSENLSTLDFVTSIMEDKLLKKDDAHHTGSQQQEKVLKIQTVSCLNEIKQDSDGLEGTRRVLKFDDSLNTVAIEPQKPMQGPTHKCAGRTLHAGQADFTVRVWDHSRSKGVLSEKLKEFRTPPDLSSVESGRSSGHSPHGAQKGSFRSMLAAFEKSHNQVIKESHN
ncbi:hypothetical protein NFI96_017262 [Prochilodus magdalenae]|nr:hypothetical protein NFI96_017262 [Prochilodus magdalenae]